MHGETVKFTIITVLLILHYTIHVSIACQLPVTSFHTSYTRRKKKINSLKTARIYGRNMQQLCIIHIKP